MLTGPSVLQLDSFPIREAVGSLMIKKILYATDLSAYSSYALMHVESLAHQYDASVYLVHAVPPLGEFTSAVVKSHCSESVKDEVLNTPHIKGLLDSIRDQVFEEIIHPEESGQFDLVPRIVDIIVIAGNPVAVILDQAEHLNVDLIVIGSHGANAIDGRILGSVTSKILQLSKIPVYMIPMLKAKAWTQESKNLSTKSNFRKH